MARKYEQDKVYLKGPNGVIWDHDPHLAKVPGYVAVVPNPSKVADEADDGAAASQTQKGQQATGEAVKK